MSNKIKVMIVDDSVFFREFMARSLVKDPSITIVGTASDVQEAKEKVAQLNPDVITLDMEMPKLRGTDFLKYVKPKHPDIRVIVISSISGNVFEALKEGAFDFVAKPNAQVKVDNAAFISETISKIKTAHNSVRTKSAPAPAPPKRPAAPKMTPGAVQNLVVRNSKSVIAIGASTGGTEAILAVLKDLPKQTSGIVIVQHMPPLFTKMYAERLDRLCQISVREAKNGDRVQPGLALIAPGGMMMRLKSDSSGYFVACREEEKISGHCPSVDALFDSVADCAGANALGVILTGMGADGAKGMLKMRKNGAQTIGQDQATSVVYGMPMVAYNLGAVKTQLPLDEISDAIVRSLSK